MSASLWFAVIWVFCGVVTAMLPMRRQYIPGMTLLVLAPVIIVYMGVQHGVIVAVLGFTAFMSMFRNPLIYLYRRLRGEKPEIPE